MWWGVLLLACGGGPETGDSGAPAPPSVDSVDSVDRDGSAATGETGASGSSGDTSGTGATGHTGDTAVVPSDTGDTGALHTGDTAAPPRLVWEASPAPCDDPARRAEAAFDTVHLAGVGTKQGYAMQAGGLVVADLDGDPAYEIVRTADGLVELYDRLPDGTWQARPDRLPALPLQAWMGASAADMDGDGDLDLALGGFDGLKALLANDGAGTFTDVTAGSGLRAAVGRSSSLAWADWDGDGVLDLAVGNYGTPPIGADNAEPSELYVGVGDGTFVDRSDLLPDLVQGAYTFHFGWFDLDDDLRPDLLAVNDYPHIQQSVLLRNTGDGFEAVEGSGFAAGLDAMGVAAGDINGDGLPDFAVTSIGDFGVYHSIAAPAEPLGVLYVDRAAELGLDPIVREFGWGADHGDVDNDGDEDLFMAFGDWNPIYDPYAVASPHADALWLQDDGDVVWFDHAPAMGVDDALTGRGSAFTDLNGDGWLDLVVATMEGPTIVHTARCGAASWLTVGLRDAATTNTRGIGARVDVHVGDTRHRRWVVAGSTSMFTGQEPRVHVGLGDVDVVDRVEVRWPDGEVSVLAGVEGRQHLTLARAWR